MAHQAGAYPGFSSMKRLGVFLLPPGWDASPSQGYPQHQIRRYPFIHLGGERHCESEVSCPRTQHRARTRSARSGVERTNHEATAPPLLPVYCSSKYLELNIVSPDAIFSLSLATRLDCLVRRHSIATSAVRSALSSGDSRGLEKKEKRLETKNKNTCKANCKGQSSERGETTENE